MLIELSARKNTIKIVDNISSSSNYLIHTDYIRFKQVLLNLLSNAIKYNRKNGSVFISCSECPDNYLKVEVQDTGAGLTRNQMDNLFVAFERLGAEQTQTQGTGIGLAIARRLIEAMDGEIGVSSIEGEGTIFGVTIPLADTNH